MCWPIQCFRCDRIQKTESYRLACVYAKCILFELAHIDTWVLYVGVAAKQKSLCMKITIDFDDGLSMWNIEMFCLVVRSPWAGKKRNFTIHLGPCSGQFSCTIHVNEDSKHKVPRIKLSLYTASYVFGIFWRIKPIWSQMSVIKKGPSAPCRFWITKWRSRPKIKIYDPTFLWWWRRLN